MAQGAAPRIIGKGEEGMITRWASLALTVVLLAAGPSAAKPSAEVTLTAAGVAEIRRAIDEQRLLDAGRMIDQAMLGGVTDPRLSLLGGDLNLVRKRYNVASPRELLDAATALGVEFIPCQMSMDMFGIKREDLIDGMGEPAGAATAIEILTEANASLFI